jgi:hypothetical protein
MRIREFNQEVEQPTDVQTPVQTPVKAPAIPAPQVNPVVDTSEVKAELDDIAQATEENPELEKSVTATLKALLNYAKKVLPTSSTPSSLEESTAVYSIIDELNSQIEHLSSAGKRFEPIINTIKEKISQLHQTISHSLEAERQAGGDEVKQNIANITQTKNKYASVIASRVGKSEGWKRGLLSALNHYDDQVGLDFLEACANGTALTITIGKTSQIAKYKLNTLVNPKLQAIFEPSNKEIFGSLLRLPFTEGTGFGAGIAPGESLLACLLPGATSAAKGDLEINGEVWEMKAGSYSFNAEKGKLGKSGAWLDCSKIAENAPLLKKAFADSILNYLTNKNKKITVDRNVYTVGDLIKLADFRPTKLPQLNTLLSLIKPEQALQVLSDTYSAIVPTVKAKNLKAFNAAVKLSLPLIQNNDSVALGKLHVKLSMFEYALGEFKATNFIFYNSTTQDIVLIQGTSAFSKSLESNYGILSTTFTMNGANKASAGVFLQADSQEEVDKTVGYVRKRAGQATATPAAKPALKASRRKMGME